MNARLLLNRHYVPFKANCNKHFQRNMQVPPKIPASVIKFDESKNRKYIHTSQTYSKNVIVSSPLNPMYRIPNETLSSFIWKQKWPDRPALTCSVSGRSYTYSMMRVLINKFAQGLLTACGLQKGDVIAIILPNMPEFIFIIYGALEANLKATFVHPMYTSQEIEKQVKDANAKVIVTIPTLLGVVKTIVPNLKDYKTTVCVEGDGDPKNNVLGLQNLVMSNEMADLPPINPMETALLPYSSGTSGLPKGVELSHYNLVANLVQISHPDLAFDPPTEVRQYVGLTILPFFHIFGFNAVANMCLKNQIHLVTIPKFTPQDYVAALVKYKPDYLFVVPALLLFMFSFPEVTKEHLRSVQTIITGAAPCPDSVFAKFGDKFGTGITIRQGYGMTETSPITLLMPKSAPISKLGSAGVLIPGTEGRIVDLTTGEDNGPHKPGELLIKGPQVMKKYLNKDRETGAIIKGGWLYTGDVAFYDDDQYFYIIDRTKALIKVKGYQVAPTELENLILEIPGVVDVAVVGIPDSVNGEVPRAYVVKDPESNLKEHQIVSYVNSKVIGYKKLAGGVKFIDLIPRNPAGKVLRDNLLIL